MAKTVTGLCVLCDIKTVVEEIVCVIENDCNRSDVRAEAEERAAHRAYSTT
jgi:hypothetical protein